ncbi:hypothetical protein [Janthinobacterium sp. HLX7-2]|uniref:hypothetical protein n=1 Tax=Janthinobacterium sp. HLX7-2 TaxID=1259331 RepID=UPI003F280B99
MQQLNRFASKAVVSKEKYLISVYSWFAIAAAFPSGRLHEGLVVGLAVGKKYCL